jgi:hypothetical protein
VSGNAFLYTSGDDSTIRVRGSSVALHGELRAGQDHPFAYDPARESMTFDATAAPAYTGQRAQVVVQAQRDLVVGAPGNAQTGGQVFATGRIDLSAGTATSGTGTGFEMSAIAGIRVDATGAGTWAAPTVDGSITIASDGDLIVRGAISALDDGADITLRSRSLVDVGGRVMADDVLTVRGGTDSSRLGVYVQAMVLDAANQYVSGGTLDTAVGGRIDVESIDGITVAGVIGERETLGASLGQAKVGSLRMQSLAGDVQLMRNVNVRDDLDVQGGTVSLLSGSYVYATGAGSTAYLKARDTLTVSGRAVAAGLDPAIAKADRLLHLVAPTMAVNGIVEVTSATGRALFSAGSGFRLTGTVLSQGDIDVHAGVAMSWDRARMESAVARADLRDGDIVIEGQGILDAKGTVRLVAGGSVTVDADAAVTGFEAIKKPVYTTAETQVQQVIGTVRVAAGTTLVPQISYVDTEITEQVGTELVVVGSRFETMKVTLSQIGYYKPNAPESQRFLETLVEGVHYLNDDTRLSSLPDLPVVNWSNAGNEQFKVRSVEAADRPSGDYTKLNAQQNPYLGFNELADAQRWAVLNATGYMPLYDFSYSDWKLNQTINGTASALPEGYMGSDGKALTPTWKPGGVENPREVYYVDIANWRDKYVRMPKGAQEAILSVGSTGEARYLDGDTSLDGQNTGGSWKTLDQFSGTSPTGELVGSWKESADVLYQQQGSAFTSSTVNGAVDYDEANYNQQTAPVSDDSPYFGATWKSSYQGSGERIYQLTDGLKSSAVGIQITETVDQRPRWDYSGTADVIRAISNPVDPYGTAASLGLDGIINWVDWNVGSYVQNNSKNSTVSGTADGVTVSFSGEAIGMNVGGKSWASHYTGVGVNNSPSPNNEYISFNAGNQSGRITFSQPVVNPVMAIQSLGRPGTLGRLFFGDEDFTVVSSGPIGGGWGSGSISEGTGGSVVNNNNEGNGVIRFNGVYDHIDWTISDVEYFGNFTIGFDAKAPAGAAGLRTSNRVIGPSDFVDGFVNDKVEKFEYVPGSTETRANQKVGWALGYADASGWPTFYQKVNYDGKSFQPKFPDLGWFGDYDFNNMADSLRFGSQTFKVIVYEHEKNTGNSLEIFGDVANFKAEHGDDWYDEIGSYKAYGYRYEDFKDHSYDWTSKPVDLFDTRIQLDYNLSTQARDVYDYRPVWKTSVQKVKVEKMQEVTVWEERPVYGTRTQIVTEVRYEDAFGGGSGRQALAHWRQHRHRCGPERVDQRQGGGHRRAEH